MKYLGSKRRIARHIIPIMEYYRKPGQVWVEPFVGGGNSISEATGLRLGSDLNPWVAQALVSIRDHVNELPRNNQEFTEAQYNELRNGAGYRFKGYAGFALAFGAKWLDSWSRNSKGRDYVIEAYNSAVKQSPKLKGVLLANLSYDALPLPPVSLIYCDPPYAGTTGYKTGAFDSEAFWAWCRRKSAEGHTVFVSEYNAPSDFKCIWARPINNELNGKQQIEKLFTRS